MNTALSPSYQMPLVGLSYVISVIGSFVALTVARRMSTGQAPLDRGHALTAGIALGGVGIWCTHFVGMMALHLGVGVGYSALETVASLLIAIAATALAFHYVARAPRQAGHLIGAGVLLGLGVGAMHYLGIGGLRFGGYMTWSYALVGLSLLIAVLAATAALWLALNTRTWMLRLAAALLMGAAVCAMHYTGMAAADFICTTENRNALPTGFGVMVSYQLPVWVTALAMATLILIVITQVIDAADSRRPAPSRS